MFTGNPLFAFALMLVLSRPGLGIVTDVPWRSWLVVNLVGHGLVVELFFNLFGQKSKGDATTRWRPSLFGGHYYQ